MGNETLLRDHLNTVSRGEPLLRRLTPADSDSYRALRLRALAEFPDAFTSSAQEEGASLEWVSERLRPRDGNLLLGAFIDGELAGTAGLERRTRTKERHKATLYGMFVVSEHAGRHVGRRIVDALIDVARTWNGLEQVTLTVTRTNTRARRLYSEAGFVTFGIEHRAMKVADEYYDKEHMVLFLN
ncbi:MAG: GNAT family N-acetyltransferase [Pseudomonadota bacterium]|nr:GNAT family N-acetyltransferase [Pseudomonadota bacterium]